MPGSEAWGYLTAPEGNGVHVGMQVCAVFVEIESVAPEATPPFLPAVVYQHIQVATAWNLVLTGKCLQVLRQRLLLGETDDACDLAAGGSAHGALKLSQAVLLPFAW